MVSVQVCLHVSNTHLDEAMEMWGRLHWSSQYLSCVHTSKEKTARAHKEGISFQDISKHYRAPVWLLGLALPRCQSALKWSLHCSEAGKITNLKVKKKILARKNRQENLLQWVVSKSSPVYSSIMEQKKNAVIQLRPQKFELVKQVSEMIQTKSQISNKT